MLNTSIPRMGELEMSQSRELCENAEELSLLRTIRISARRSSSTEWNAHRFTFVLPIEDELLKVEAELGKLVEVVRTQGERISKDNFESSQTLCCREGRLGEKISKVERSNVVEVKTMGHDQRSATRSEGGNERKRTCCSISAPSMIEERNFGSVFGT